MGRAKHQVVVFGAGYCCRIDRPRRLRQNPKLLEIPESQVEERNREVVSATTQLKITESQFQMGAKLKKENNQLVSATTQLKVYFR